VVEGNRKSVFVVVDVIGFEVVGTKGNRLHYNILHSFLFHFNAGFVFCPFCLVLFLLLFPFVLWNIDPSLSQKEWLAIVGFMWILSFVKEMCGVFFVFFFFFSYSYS